MHRFNKINNLLGWTVFMISGIIYLLTLEPTASWWDPGEFIVSAYKLEVGHPPGAPIHIILGRFFSLFAPDKSQAAFMINLMSGLASAATVMLLYWSIVHLVRKLFSEKQLTPAEQIAVCGSGVVGALAFAFTDSFWFSAVEGEVYALSSFFTAAVFWAILKWENEADHKYANRWLILIAYLLGLSTGVHLLNLLAIPAIGLVYYFRMYQFSWKGFITAFIISMAVLAAIQSVIIPGVPLMAFWSDLFFVNILGLPFNTGMLFFIVLAGCRTCMGHQVHAQKQDGGYEYGYFVGDGNTDRIFIGNININQGCCQSTHEPEPSRQCICAAALPEP
jgi:ABC-type multidrug transport system fused ATPase/permease subunit